jgi:5-methylcytosine-specific restriction endonuclease McrA
VRSQISLPSAPAGPTSHPADPARPLRTTDRRYGSNRWRKTAKAVLVRDLYVCRIVPGCPVRATVADHIIPAAPEMSDSLFFGMDNLRAGCKDHNILRGKAARLERESAAQAPTDVERGDYS